MKTRDTLIYEKLVFYWFRIIQQVSYQRRKLVRSKRDDYPTVIVGCRYGNIRKCGRSMNSTLPQYNRNGKLNLHGWVENAVNKALEENDTSKGSWFDKSCAEDHAASKCLFACEKSRIRIPLPNSLTDLEFTVALRPRTGGVVEYCNTCKAVFGL